MITMPGLPMFGHGQIEGFAEKYGMEYKRAYYNEFVDDNLVRTHEDQIFPLMQKRYLFSQVENFEFFDFIDDSGNVNESVFVYTNRNEYERALILYNNSYQECQGPQGHGLGSRLDPVVDIRHAQQAKGTQEGECSADQQGKVSGQSHGTPLLNGCPRWRGRWR